MKTIIRILILLTILAPAQVLFAQDVRTLETRVADLLARLPAGSQEMTVRLMEEMFSLGPQGADLICRQVVEAGTGDDTRARYAVSSLTAYLSKDSDQARKAVWEQTCLRYIGQSSSAEVKSFFIRQLNLTGTDASVNIIKPYLNDKMLCSDAVMALQSTGTAGALKSLADALSSDTCHCATQIMNALSAREYAGATSAFISWYSKGTSAEKTSALWALSSGGSPEALPVLTEAAEKAGYKWDPTGSVASLTYYAGKIGSSGNIRTMNKILGKIISESSSNGSTMQRLAAMDVAVTIQGRDALPMLLSAVNDPDPSVRAGVIRMAGMIPGPEATKKWISKYKKARPEAKTDLLYMFGERGDNLALPLINKALSDANPDIANEAVTALVKIDGRKAIDPVIAWIKNSESEEGHWIAASALRTVLDSTDMTRIEAGLAGAEGHAAVTFIQLLAWSGSQKFFSTITRCLNTDDIVVRASALSALKNVAGPGDQSALISMLNSTGERPEITELQAALGAAAMRTPSPEKKSEVILTALDKGGNKNKLIPVLGLIGDATALRHVKNEFDNGSAAIRDVCFDVLSHWPDESAAPALFDICASGNKTFERPAFDAYLRMVSASSVTPDNKLLLLKKIEPFALTSEAKVEVISLAGSLNIYPAYFFIKDYLLDESEAIRTTAENVIEEMNLPDKDTFTSLFNGKDLTGWQGLVGNPLTRAAMNPSGLAARQKEADMTMVQNWSAKDGILSFTGKGDNICTVKEYGDFEMFIDWSIPKKGDSGIYLRGTPQVQIWDTSLTDVGAQVGSGGLYNNQVNPAIPLMVADNPVDEWNTFRIVMKGDRVSVWLNGQLVTDNVVMENYWNRAVPIFEKGQIELQAHNSELFFRDMWIRELTTPEYILSDEEKSQGFVPLFNGRNLDGWTGNKVSYRAEEGVIVIRPGDESGGNLYTEKEYGDFILRFEFQLTPGANNGLGIRAPLTGDAAYVGMELQILDNDAPIYATLHPWQYHGSVYGVIAARRGFLKPVGEWNSEEVIIKGTHVKVILNGTEIVNGDFAEAREKGTVDGKDHPGLWNDRGHIGFLGHGSLVSFRNIRIRELQ